MTNGKFVISLDFELHWGFFDNRTLTDCRDQLDNINTVINNLLLISNQYETDITFATVGFLFAKDKNDVLKFLPKLKPDYENVDLNSYTLLEHIKEDDQKFYFAQSLLEKIKKDGRHEVGTHTFCHYYCHEKGQSINDFEEDIKSAVSIAKSLNIATKSIVFPRNQILNSYLKICEDLEIESYRGNCWFNFNNDSKQRKLKEYALVILRVFDTYFNLSGSNSFKLDDHNTKRHGIINIPASRFLRPYSSKLKSFESLKIRRIKKAMTSAAKRNEIYHLWWHPHNFADNIDENFKNFESIAKHYKFLNDKYNFESITMSKLAKAYKK